MLLPDAVWIGFGVVLVLACWLGLIWIMVSIYATAYVDAEARPDRDRGFGAMVPKPTGPMREMIDLPLADDAPVWVREVATGAYRMVAVEDIEVLGLESAIYEDGERIEIALGWWEA